MTHESAPAATCEPRWQWTLGAQLYGAGSAFVLSPAINYLTGANNLLLIALGVICVSVSTILLRKGYAP